MVQRWERTGEPPRIASRTMERTPGSKEKSKGDATMKAGWDVQGDKSSC